MVVLWSNEEDDEPDKDTTTNDGKTDSGTTSTSDATDSNQSPTKKIPRLKRNGSTRSAKRKKQSFAIYVKEPSTMNDTLDDWFEISDPSHTSNVRVAFRTFQTTSRKLVLPGHDISSLLPEALSLNGIWWVDKASLSLARTEHMQYLESLRSMYSPSPDRNLQLLCFDVQSKLQSPQSEEQLMDYMQGSMEELLRENKQCVFYSDFGLFGEVKPPEKDRRKCIRIQDFWKLVRMAKDEINSPISKGVDRPMMILIQVFGFQLDMFLMTMDPDEGFYVLHKAAEGFLPRSVSDMSGIGNIVSIFMRARALLQEFQDQLNGTRPYTVDVNDPPKLQKFVKGDIIFPE
ncbi:hypothetical protein BGX27_001478 [Mortierella sp. AM989]|nr:hypothetical protein BGX27_001478 [Mortierella sp. AM989]